MLMYSLSWLSILQIVCVCVLTLVEVRVYGVIKTACFKQLRGCISSLYKQVPNTLRNCECLQTVTALHVVKANPLPFYWWNLFSLRFALNCAVGERNANSCVSATNISSFLLLKTRWQCKISLIKTQLIALKMQSFTQRAAHLDCCALSPATEPMSVVSNLHRITPRLCLNRLSVYFY